MSRFRKLPVEVEAMQYRVEDGMDNVHALAKWGVSFYSDQHDVTGAMMFWIAKGSTWGHVRPGDWIIKEPDGNGFYPCVAADFAATYEPVA